MYIDKKLSLFIFFLWFTYNMAIKSFDKLIKLILFSFVVRETKEKEKFI